MKIAGLVYAAVKLWNETFSFANKTIVQKLVYFSLPREERPDYYEAYFYGPFSKTVQAIYNTLVNKDFLSYDCDQNFFSIKQDTSIENVDMENRLRLRLDAVIKFLKDEQLNDTKKIANLSKIHILGSNTEENNDFTEIIREKAAVFGWREVMEMNDQSILATYRLAQKLDGILDGVSEHQVH